MMRKGLIAKSYIWLLYQNNLKSNSKPIVQNVSKYSYVKNNILIMRRTNFTYFLKFLK